MSSQGNTLSTCNGGATGLLKDIQRRLSNSGILPVFKPEAPSLGYESSLVFPTSNKPIKLKNVATGSESYDSLHTSGDHVSFYLYLLFSQIFYLFYKLDKTASKCFPPNF